MYYVVFCTTLHTYKTPYTCSWTSLLRYRYRVHDLLRCTSVPPSAQSTVARWSSITVLTATPLFLRRENCIALRMFLERHAVPKQNQVDHAVPRIWWPRYAMHKCGMPSCGGWLGHWCASRLCIVSKRLQIWP